MIIFYSETKFELKKKRIYKKWLSLLAQREQRFIGNINYIFCDDDYLLKLNIQYLQHDTLTDIITFDDGEKNILNGDIYISIERVRENADIFKVTFEEELIRVIAHGVLHLCGYKDKTDVEAALMRRKEEEAIYLFSQILNHNNLNNK